MSKSKAELKNLLRFAHQRIERDTWRIERVRELEAEVATLERLLVRVFGDHKKD